MPRIRGKIDRRVLINYRCDPNALDELLPCPFRPKLFNGYGIAGICLIRLRELRPTFLPAWTGVTSENAAHRTAIEWYDNDQLREGVFIPRRDTNSSLNQLAGGRLFPGIHHAARFQSMETKDNCKIEVLSTDEKMRIRIAAHVTDKLPVRSVSDDLDQVVNFFRSGSVGWSPGRAVGTFDGLELQCQTWKMEPLAVEHVTSSFFEDRSLFPSGTAEFDSAFMMRNVDHTWNAQGKLLTTARNSL